MDKTEDTHPSEADSVNPKPLPDSLFRYYSLREAKRAELSALLKEGNLWLSNPRFFNDPFDLLPRFDELVQKTLEKALTIDHALHRRSSHEPFEQFLERRKKRVQTVYANTRFKYPSMFRNDVGKSFGVACFSAEVEDVLMWSHYADSHSGIAIEFDTHDPAFSGRLGMVRYVTSRPQFRPEAAADILFSKDREWSREKEARCVYLLSDARFDPASERHFFSISKSSIRSIRIGWMAKSYPESVDWLLDLLRDSRFDRKKVFAMCASMDRFTLVKESLKPQFFYDRHSKKVK